jgi:outer membrane protein OmpA-like peptidoglycan-associated protein
MISRLVFGVAAVLAGGLAMPAAAQSVDELAKQLAAPSAAAPAGCSATLPDGSCADEPDTRQMVLGRATPAARPIRADIKMSFLVNSANLTAQARATLDRFAAALVRVGSYRPFVVEGHTDQSGSRAANLALSQARANSVVDYLAGRGVDRKRLTAQGYGPDRPLQGRTPDDPANRRVEVSAQ